MTDRKAAHNIAQHKRRNPNICSPFVPQLIDQLAELSCNKAFLKVPIFTSPVFLLLPNSGFASQTPYATEKGCDDAGQGTKKTEGKEDEYCYCQRLCGFKKSTTTHPDCGAIRRNSIPGYAKMMFN